MAKTMQLVREVMVLNMVAPIAKTMKLVREVMVLTVVAPMAKTMKLVREVMVMAMPAFRIVSPISSTIGRSFASAAGNGHKIIIW